MEIHTDIKDLCSPMANDTGKALEVELDLEEDGDGEDWGDWTSKDEDAEEGDDLENQFCCLFCESMYSSCDILFEHCSSCHHFDFHCIRQTLGLDFYGCFKLINYVRSQVARNRCWSCELSLDSYQDLLDHLHEAKVLKGSILPWDDDKYLQPFRHDDSLLYSFDEIEDIVHENGEKFDESEKNIKNSSTDVLMDDMKNHARHAFTTDKSVAYMASCISDGSSNSEFLSVEGASNDSDGNGRGRPFCNIGKYGRVLSPRTFPKEANNVDVSYFRAYSSFGIHREMLGDMVRMDAYRRAILKNPSLFNGAVVMDVGCGTGILSLFAAEAGASKVIAVEGSSKMACVAAQIANVNGFLSERTSNAGRATGVIEVISCMVEKLDTSVDIQPSSIDVLVSEWMGYCLLYESMLPSVLYARDRWLKPGGAILPDTATLFVAGFGRGATSLPFWEDVYGFDMSCVGREVTEDAAATPIVDYVDLDHLVTNHTVLQNFDLVEMEAGEMDFTATVELEPKSESAVTLCYGLVLWFETGFSGRFCREEPTVLSTSPHGPRTHWAQTILTFGEPIAVGMGEWGGGEGMFGSFSDPCTRIQARISIARGLEHRTIDISVEITGVVRNGTRRSWKPQLFVMN